jgi:F-type H+-transporting ATPase subunit b
VSFDPWTLFLQFLNFAVLLFVLYRLVFKPVREIMEKRQAQVAASLDGAEQARREAEAITAGLAREQARVEQLRAEAMERMQGEVEEARRALLAAAAKEAGDLREKGLALLEADRAKSETQIREVSVRTVTALAARLLEDLADETLHRGVLRRFPGELDRVAADLAAVPPSAEPLTVHLESAYPLTGEEEAQLRSLIAGRVAGAALVTATEGSLLAGVRLRARDRVYDLSLRGRLDALAARLKELA